LPLSQHYRAAVRGWIGVHTVEFVLDVDYLRVRPDGKLRVENSGAVDAQILLLNNGESARDDADLVLAGGERRERVRAGAVGHRPLLASRPAKLDDRARNRRARRVGDFAAQGRLWSLRGRDPQHERNDGLSAEAH